MSISQFAVAAAAATEPSIGVVVATGLVIVFSVLILLYLMITVEGVIFKSIDNKKAGKKTADKPAAPSAPAAPMARAQAQAPAVQKGIPGEVIAAITAAIASMEGGSRFSIRSVTRAKQGRNAWGNAASAGYTEPF